MQIDLDHNWLESALGQYMLDAEQQFYDQHVANIFGYHALQVGFNDVDLLSHCRIPKLIHTSSQHGQVMAETEYMPFDSDSIDLVCLPHSLEFCEDPHQSLREIARILVPEGYVLLTGFNPVSSWGLRRRLSKRKDYPWCGRSLTAGRIKDWLKLLGFEIAKTGYLAYAMPINDARWLNRLHGIERFNARYCPVLGGVYFIIAKKRVVNMQLLKPKWKKTLSAKGLIPTPGKMHAPDAKREIKKMKADEES